MKQARVSILLIFLFQFLGMAPSRAQQTYRLSINEATELALQNHPQLAVSRSTVAINRQQVRVAELQRIPSLTASASASYLGDVYTLNKNFGEKTDIDIPNFGNTFGIQAGQLLFKGGLIKKTIESAELRTQLAELDLVRDEQNIKFLVLSNYLDIVRIDNQIKALNNNKRLAEIRLGNVREFYKQEMITKNEVIRGELAIQSLNQALLTATNTRQIINFQLNIALGLPDSTYIEPTDKILPDSSISPVTDYYDAALAGNPAILAGRKNIELAGKNIEIAKTDRLPGISVIGGYNMQRPLMNSFPARDIYLNAWQVGLSLSYNIDNIYKTGARVRSTELVREQATQVLSLTELNIKTGINAAYVRYNEAIAQEKIARESKRLADENYKITEAKYLNQLAVLAEMIDAQNQKIQADIDYENAVVNIRFQYFNLLKAAGTL